MKALYAALWAESLKTWRSKMLWITVLAFAFISIMMGIFVFIANHPDLVGGSAIMSLKASVIGKSDWKAYFGLLHQVIAMIGLIGFSFVLSWVFGREYSDRTIKDILALPVSRSMIVISKFIIFLIWCAFLAIVLFVIALVTGLMVNIPGWSVESAINAFRIYTVTSVLTFLLCTPVAFFAGWGRGYLLPIGFIIFIMIITQFVVIGVPGLAPYVPWAIPALYCGAAGPFGPHAGTLSYILLILTSILGLIGTIAWWRFADQN
jgi:ABC-2 type transport system permease protein